MLKKLAVAISVLGALSLAILPSVVRLHAQIASGTQTRATDTVAIQDSQSNDGETADDSATAINTASAAQPDTETQDTITEANKETSDSIQGADDKETNDSAVDTDNVQEGNQSGPDNQD